jgi:hypothetical protein
MYQGLVLGVMDVGRRQLTWWKQILEDSPSILGVLSSRLDRHQAIGKPGGFPLPFDRRNGVAAAGGRSENSGRTVGAG